MNGYNSNIDVYKGGGPDVMNWAYKSVISSQQPSMDPVFASLLANAPRIGNYAVITPSGQDSYFDKPIEYKGEQTIRSNPNPQSSFNGISAKDAITIDAIVLRSTPIGQQPSVARQGFSQVGYYQ
jgi:hypothetical protein